MTKIKREYWLSEEGLLLIASWVRDGADDLEISKKLGISPATLLRWKKKYPEIFEALKKNQEIADIEVENALLKRCLGYSYQEKKLKITEKGKEETITTKEMPPDISAISVWLKNRRPGKWREKPCEDDREVFEKLDAIMEEIDDDTL